MQGYYHLINKDELKNNIKINNNNFCIWACYFFIDNNKIIKLLPTQLILSLNNDNNIVINSLKYTDNDILNNKHLYISEDKNDIISFFNDIIYKYIVEYQNRILMLKQDINIYNNIIIKSKSNFIDSDIIMEKLIH